MGIHPAHWADGVMVMMVVLLGVTIINRARRALEEIA